jgi:4-amino-4-deoxy-L-arabinose transferase-like glycosyltransferase
LNVQPGHGRVAALFAFALIVRLAYVGLYPQLPVSADARDYDLLAESIGTGRGFVDQAGRAESLRAPLYPYFLAAIYRLFGKDTTLVRIAQGVVGATVPLLTLMVARRHFGDTVAWVAAGAAAVYPALVAYCGLLLTETLSTFLACLVALTTSILWRRRTALRAIAAGLSLGAATLCRAEWMTVAFVFIAALATFRSRTPAEDDAGRVDLRTPLLVALVFASTLAPWTVRNHRALGGFAPVTTDGWRTLWIATYPGGWLEWKREEPLLSIEGPPDMPPLERAQRFRTAALRNLREAPLTYLRLCARRVLLLWAGSHGNAISGLESSTSRSRGWILVAKLGLFALNLGIVLLAFVGIWMSRPRWRELLPLLVCIVVPSATYVLLFAVPRYHVPLLPLLFPFAAEALLSRCGPGMSVVKP